MFYQSFPWWVAVVGLVVAIIATALSYRWTGLPPSAQDQERPRSLSRRIKYVLVTLRTVSIGILLFCLLEPTLISREEIRKKPNLLLLVDDSQSMSLTDMDNNASRIDAVKSSLDSAMLGEFSDKFDLRLYQFSAEPTLVEKLSLKAEGTLTDIGKAISKAESDWKGQPIAGIVLITDGANNSGDDPIKVAQQTGIQVHAVGVGNPNPPRDIQISKVDVNPIAYVDHLLPVRVSIKSGGYDGREVHVSLMQESELKDSIPLILKDGEQEVEFRVKPQQEGALRFRVSIPPMPDEITAQNNVYQFFVKAVKTKLKVLYIDGRPRWEYTFLNRALQRDPNIEATSLVTTKQNTYYPRSPADRISVSSASFPNTKSELFSYDVIIIGDISSNFFKDEQLNMIGDFVENKGGGVIFLGGKYSLGSGGFGESRLRDMLPIRIKQGGARQVVGAFNPVLTQHGLTHPITRFSDNRAENIAIWRDLPPLTQFYEGAAPSLGATILAEREHEPGMPVIAFQRYGKGAVLMIASDTLWRWAFGAYPFGGDDSYYRKFWASAIRWLASVRVSADKVVVETDKTIINATDTVRITLYVYNESYEPINDAQIKAQVQTPSGTLLDLSFTPGGDGRYLSEFSPNTDGNYKISVSAKRGETLIGESSAEFVVQAGSPEFQEPSLNESLLKSLANVSGGSYRNLNDISNLPHAIKEVSNVIVSVRERSIWDNVPLLITVIALLSAEWLLRKRRGLI